jgi:hypothetical protein
MGQIWISNGAAVLDSILIEPLNRTAECRVPAPAQHRCFPGVPVSRSCSPGFLTCYDETLLWRQFSSEGRNAEHEQPKQENK